MNRYHTIAAGKWHSGQEPTKNEWYLAISNGGSGNNPPQFAVQMGSTKYTAAGTPLPVGAWYHLVGVREGTRIKLYVDGVLKDVKNVGTGTVNNIPTRDILIRKMGNDKYLQVGFDEFVVYRLVSFISHYTIKKAAANKITAAFLKTNFQINS